LALSNNINVRLTGIENRLTGIENRLTATENRLTGIENRLVRNFNSSALTGAHLIEPPVNDAGQLPVNVGVWFPRTRSELFNINNARAVALIAHYNLAVPPGVGTIFSRRLQFLKDYIGNRE
jgi:hypothetical protein